MFVVDVEFGLRVVQWTNIGAQCTAMRCDKKWFDEQMLAKLDNVGYWKPPGCLFQ